MSSLISLSKLFDIQGFCALKSKTLIMFSSPGYAPCKILEPIIEKIAAKYPEEIGFAHVESTNENAEVYSFFNIVSAPTIILFDRTEPVAFKNGFRSEADLMGWLAEKLV
jgi:putative thioredoxin